MLLLFSKKRDLVVTSNENHQIIHLFKIIKIFHQFKKFEYHRIGNFSNNIDLRKHDFLSAEKSYHSRFVLLNQLYMTSLFIERDFMSSKEKDLPSVNSLYIRAKDWLKDTFTPHS